MTVLVDDPLIASMAIRRALPLHESSRRLRELYPECPRVYGVAVMGDLSRRRWWPLTEALTTDRLPRCSSSPPRRPTAAPRSPSSWPRRWRMWSSDGSFRSWCSKAAHGIRGWRTCGCMSIPRVRSTGSGSSIRRCAPCPTIRSSVPPGGWRAHRSARDGIVALPNEAALTTWIAHRSHRTLEPLFGKLAEVSDSAMSIASMWHIVGAAVVGAATQVPLLAGSSELTSMRRGQAVLDALVGFGLPVRGSTRPSAVHDREGLAKLGQPCLLS